MSNRLFQDPTGVAQKAYAPSLQHPDRQNKPARTARHPACWQRQTNGCLTTNCDKCPNGWS